ncbi:MAG: PKD domain-containing protein [Thermoplasmata archaeon]|nr:MAG: PKD domain-containing protein [Thermoplasmata archaeon]
MATAPRTRIGRSWIVWAVFTFVMIAWVLPIVSPPASAVTEYRYEVIAAPPTPLDYKGVAWSADGTEATIVGGIQALLRYDSDSRIAQSVGDGNWSTASQTLEDVVYAADGTQWISGGKIDESSIAGDLWQLEGDNVLLRGTAEGDVLVAVAASPYDGILAVGALGSVQEYANDSLESVGTADTVLHDAAWAPDGTGVLMVGAAGTMIWYDASDGQLTSVDFTSTHPLYAVAWHPDSDIAWAVGEGGLVVEVDKENLEASRVRPYTPRTEDLFGVSWHPNGELALIVGEEGIAYLYRSGIFTQQRVDTNKYLLDVAWNPEGDEALVVGESGTLLRYAPWLTPQNRAPNAVITQPLDGAEVEENTLITFDGSSSTDPEDDLLTFAWSANDTGLLGTDDVIERYLPLGSHHVTLTVDDGQGNNDTTTVTITVVEAVPPEDRLHLSIITPKAGSMMDGEVVISGTASYELGDIAGVEVAIDGGGWHPAEGTEVWSYTYDTRLLLDGIHSIVVKVTTEDGVWKVEDILIEVRNQVEPEPPEVPNVTLHLREHGEVDELIRFWAEGDGLSEWLLVWSFGDGSNGQGSSVHHAYSEEGTYTVALALWIEGSPEPAAVYTATVVIEEPPEEGMSVETMIFLSLVIAGAIYIAGYYGGRRAFGKD